jgi:acetate kinase
VSGRARLVPTATRPLHEAAPSCSAPRILVLNAGSSSLKAALIATEGHTATSAGTIARAEVDWGADASRAGDRDAGVREALRAVGIGDRGHQADGVAAVGHRIVHGGGRFTHATALDDAALAAIRAVSHLAPLHNEVGLATFQAARRALPDIPHVASFDTAFHASLPPEAIRYPVPERWYRDWGVRRYGFHGLSVAWSVRRTGDLLERDPAALAIVVAHLGSGCSVTAVHRGRSVDTSMGMTPLEGLMMGTRAGSIDPGIVTRLVVAGQLDAGEVADALDHASGLLGVSGRSADVRELLDAEAAGDERSTLALAMFVRRAAAAIAAAATTLPRLDAIVFTGGIGARSDPIRRRIVDRLGVIGVPPIPAGDPSGDTDGSIGDPTASVAILRVEAREDLIIAAEAAEVVGELPDRPA